MRYVTLAECRQIVFPYIHSKLTMAEPAPDYEHEPSGLSNLDKVLGLVRTDYYPTIYDKAAYMVCSIAGSQYYSNGNKRLAVVVLLEFLVKNEAEVRSLNHDQYAHLLSEVFPLHSWEDNQQISDPHALLLYNLAITIGDAKRRGTKSFSTLRQKVS